jgi:hypothetical protein
VAGSPRLSPAPEPPVDSGPWALPRLTPRLDHHQTVFIDDYVPIQRSVLVANAWLLSHGSELAGQAAEASTALSAITLGVPRQRIDSLVIPIEWSAVGPTSFRRIDGDLETARLDPATTHLRLSASCQLAIAAPGSRSQEADAQRATEHHVRAFLAALANALETCSGD